MIRLIVSAINTSFTMISHRRQKADKDTRLGHVILSLQICVLVTMINLWSLFWIIVSALVSLDQFLFTFCEKCHAFRKSGKKIKSNYSSLHSSFKLEKSIKSKKQNKIENTFWRIEMNCDESLLFYESCLRCTRLVSHVCDKTRPMRAEYWESGDQS